MKAECVDISDLSLTPDCSLGGSWLNDQCSKTYTLEFRGDNEAWAELSGTDRFIFNGIEMVTDNLPNEEEMLKFNGSNDRDSATILIPVDNWRKAVELYLNYKSE